MADFVNILRVFDHRIHNLIDIGLIFIENVKYSILIKYLYICDQETNSYK